MYSRDVVDSAAVCTASVNSVESPSDNVSLTCQLLVCSYQNSNNLELTLNGGGTLETGSSSVVEWTGTADNVIGNIVTCTVTTNANMLPQMVSVCPVIKGKSSCYSSTE